MIQKPLSIGSLAVAIFIVLSGFCLAIPVVNNNLELRGGFKRYISRRAKRLIPPYYVALIFSIGLICMFPVLQRPENTAWDSKIPITFGGVISHIGLFHNLNPDWIFKINGAHWSIATEWQIYWFFPIILFLWRKFNVFVSFIFVFGLAMVFYKVIPYAAPEFLVLFFMGVICCKLSFNASKLRQIDLPFSIIALVLVLIFFMTRKSSPLLMNLVVGLLFSYFLYSAIVFKRLKETRIFLLESKPIDFLGRISYSLYLIHGPILALANIYLLKNFELTDDLRQLILFVFIFIFIIPLSTVFFHLVEKRFLNK